MGSVIPFSEFKEYYAGIRDRAEFAKGAILDTNILIALTYELKSNHEEVSGFFQECLIPERDKGFRLFSTVTTRAEFLDFNRRLAMTENLRDIIDEASTWKVPARAKAQIQYQSGQLKRREQQGGDAVFNDTQIKAIKGVFSAGRFSGFAGWIALCEDFLGGKLEEIESHLSDYGIEYISQNDSTQKTLFHSNIEWAGAKNIAEQTCLGLSDSMIINAFQCSDLPFMVSADFDIGYAVLSSKALKNVVMPDEVAKKYRDLHFH